MQIKCGTSYFEEESSEVYVYRGSLKHLNYWLNHSLKVVLILCHPVTQVCYWTPIEPHSVQLYKKGWSIAVPKKNTLTQNHIYSLESVTESPQAPDVIPPIMYRLICEKFSGIHIHNILETPRDFLYFDEMASYKGELLLIKYVYKPVHKFEVSDIEDVVEGRRQCGAACGWGDREKGIRVLVFFVAHTAADLILSKSVKRRLDELDDVAYYRVKLDLAYGVSINEVDDKGGLIQLYDRETGDPETFGWKA